MTRKTFKEKIAALQKDILEVMTENGHRMSSPEICAIIEEKRRKAAKPWLQKLAPAGSVLAIFVFDPWSGHYYPAMKLLETAGKVRLIHFPPSPGRKHGSFFYELCQ